jgi:outer membrane protein OmpA-like peptidoglycan-associated protein
MKKINVLLGTLAVSVGLLQGCSSYVSWGLSDDGKQAEQIIFPDLDKAWRNDGGPEGTFPDLADLRKVAPGVTKEQLYGMFGVPQFAEGMWGVREWDYIFQLQGPKDTKPTLCQYKIIFDTEYKGQSFYWKPESCAALVGGASSNAGRYTLNNEILFPHNRSSVADIRSEGREAVRNLATKIQNDYQSVDKIAVVGYTDRLGSDAHNLALSQARANAIRSLLVNEGLDASKMTAVGAGESNPLSQGCVGNTYTPALSACLQADRRVEINVTGQRK